ncbi:MAG: 1-phosphofructokinase family hexose kinase [Acidobacteriota bacterium]|nr:1-phosphofructokinase family hexose kinase [Acidobacteriota bacterium]
MLNSPLNALWCVSANPAIDKRLHVSALTPGRVNRASAVRAMPGGKAAHVAMVLRILGTDPLWLGFSGGRSGEQLVSGLRALGIRVHHVTADQDTRVNLEIIDEQGCVTELLEPGSALTDENWREFYRAYEALLSEEKSSGLVIASGSVPPGTDPDIYRRLTELAHQYGHKMFLDTSGEPLRRALAFRPDFIKPNREEAEGITGGTIGDLHGAMALAERLIQLGARSVVVSLGHEGLLWHLGAGQEVYHAQPVRVKVRSTVGCGDATVAAFVYAVSAGLRVEETLSLAAACGAANCLAESPGRIREQDVRNLQMQVQIEKLS